MFAHMPPVFGSPAARQCHRAAAESGSFAFAALTACTEVMTWRRTVSDLAKESFDKASDHIS